MARTNIDSSIFLLQLVCHFNYISAKSICSYILIDALEAEEVGVEHLLRDVKDSNISTLATQINNKVSSLKSLIARLEEMHQYLEDVSSNNLPINHTVCILIMLMIKKKNY